MTDRTDIDRARSVIAAGKVKEAGPSFSDALLTALDELEALRKFHQRVRRIEDETAGNDDALRAVLAAYERTGGAA